MSNNKNLKDIQWLTQAIESETLDLHTLSFFLSQENTNCYQETEISMTINISPENQSHFSLLLRALGSSEISKSSLQNLGFHLVKWEPEQLQNLGYLLDDSNKIKQISFWRNKFSTERLSEFSEIVKRNTVLKEIVFSESGIGAMGAGYIASALTVNNSLEELQIWEDSIHSKGAEELSKMIEVNPTLKLLTIFDSSSITAFPIISAVLARNRNTELHFWSKRGKKRENISKVVEFVPENGTLRIYTLDSANSSRVACALGWNSTVRSLDLTGVRLRSHWAKEFRWVLEQNRTLKEVILSNTCLRNKGAVYLSAGLFKNKYLENLYLDGNWFSGVGIEHLLCPLSRFSSLQIQANTTLKSLTFGGGKSKIGRDGLVSILRMLLTNQTLTRLGIYDDKSLIPKDFIKIFKSFEKNASLKYLSLRGCKGVKGEMVLQAIMETLQVNPWLEGLDLTGTPLETSGKTEEIYRKLGQNGNIEINVESETDLFKDMAMVVPKSCRVFLCGQEYSGKTTLSNSISQNFSSTKLPNVGIKIKTLKDEETKISIWNLANQHEFYSFHDLMFPGHGSASFFVIVSNLFRKSGNGELKNLSEIEEDLQCWLRFIVSNLKRAVQQCMLPNVAIVLSHCDKIDQNSPSRNFQEIIDLIQKLRDKFQGSVEFCPTVFTVDGRSSSSATKLAQHIRQTSKSLLERAPRVYEICNDLIEILSDWRSSNYNKPTMRWHEFSELCQVRVPPLRIQSRNDNKEKIETRRRAIARCLHNIGEIVYFDEFGFLILDCEWLCSEVLSQLVKLEAKKLENHGFVSGKELEKIIQGNLKSQVPGIGSKVLENLDSSDLVKIMSKLELCYEQDPKDPNSLLLVPCLLEDGRGRPQRWQLNARECVYAGRHLECDDSSHTLITPSFFPQLQVQLHNKITGLKTNHGATFHLEKYLVLINFNGINVRVELGGKLDHYIDILACSIQNLTETLRLIHQLIIPTIQSCCCNIVTLNESVIRPECVRDLMPPRYRKKAQFVRMQQLKEALLSVPAESMYDYQHTWSSVSDSGKQILSPGFDYARDLLSDDDFREVLNRRYHDLYNLANELQIPPQNNNNPGEIIEQNIEPTFGGIAKGVEEVIQRLKIIEREIKDLKQEIQGLRYYEHKLLIELNRKMNLLINYNVQLEERKTPNMFYFVETENYSRRLVTSIISGMNAVKLHMLCEYRQEMHVVEDQLGCELMHIDNIAVKCIAPYMKKFMTLLTFSLKIGAHLAVGMGGLIPDLSKEVGHLLESSAMVGAVGAGVVGAAAIGGAKSRYTRSRDIQEEQRAAQQWVIDFLRDQRCSSGKDIAEKFGLWRVRYRDSGEIVWICRRHMYTRANEIVEVPV